MHTFYESLIPGTWVSKCGIISDFTEGDLFELISLEPSKAVLKLNGILYNINPYMLDENNKILKLKTLTSEEYYSFCLNRLNELIKQLECI